MVKLHPTKASRQGPTQRQQKVAEELRRVLAPQLQRIEFVDEHSYSHDISITVTQVTVSACLKRARVYYLPMDMEQAPLLKDYFKQNARHYRKQLAHQVTLKFLPELYFELDTEFERAHRLNTLLRSSVSKGENNPEDDEQTS